MFCSKCKEKLSSFDKFCPACGEKLKNSSFFEDIKANKKIFKLFIVLTTVIIVLLAALVSLMFHSISANKRLDASYLQEQQLKKYEKKFDGGFFYTENGAAYHTDICCSGLNNATDIIFSKNSTQAKTSRKPCKLCGQ